MEYGIAECDFWQMSIPELKRAVDSKKRVLKAEAEAKARITASFDYVLADLIGRSISRIYNSANKMPDISEAYPSLFDSKEIEEKKQEKKDKLSALRFKQFAESYNKKFKGVGNN